ncbi:heme-dependent oxidative N-demethylase family protein [Rossellomorea aquimaris]|uniref:heme-dependent oxidative N-demethylase family protein n=1 Tax=Rossellomorea aquimaris TaxID=189382 RepID=UPI0012E76756|nr:DUF3445 domain-containing protein [Rossellomorea aquimaris]
MYRYSNNSLPLEPPISIQLTPSYCEEIKLKRELLTEHPKRCFQSRPHAMRGQWEIVHMILEHLVSEYPNHFSLEKNGENWTFHNHILSEKQSFVSGDHTTLPFEPLDFIGRHVQEDLILMMERDGDLFLDAGQLCFPANWSLAFNVGMSFKEIHRPIPGFKEEGLDDRIVRFLMRMEAGEPWSRRNWSLMAGSRLDTSLETFDVWGKGRNEVTKENVGELVHLRVEVQKLFRLPRSNSILFTIHTHLLPLRTFVENKEWRRQFFELLKELPDQIAEYKGLSQYRQTVLEYLKSR